MCSNCTYLLLVLNACMKPITRFSIISNGFLNLITKYDLLVWLFSFGISSIIVIYLTILFLNLSVQSCTTLSSQSIWLFIFCHIYSIVIPPKTSQCWCPILASYINISFKPIRQIEIWSYNSHLLKERGKYMRE